MTTLSWEQAVAWLCEQPEYTNLVRACYYDDPLLQAAQRFEASEEWQALRRMLPSSAGHVLDLGAGRGISSYALACAGWQVTALDPDPSPRVGARAIRKLAEQTHLPIVVVESVGEQLPFANRSFNLVYGRQVLHHARNLQQLCGEVARVLRPGGYLIATREHVISKREDLVQFLRNHPLHHLYGGEQAFLLTEYCDAIRGAGLRLHRVLGPADSPVNYFPMSYSEWLASMRQPVARRLGSGVATSLINETHLVGKCLLRLLIAYRNYQNQTPGRLYSFVAQRS